MFLEWAKAGAGRHIWDVSAEDSTQILKVRPASGRWYIIWRHSAYNDSLDGFFL